MAGRMATEGGATSADRLTYGFRLATGRRPTPVELSVLSEGYTADLARFTKDPAAAKKLLSFGDPTIGAKAGDPAEMAALTLAANVLLNLDEVVTRE